MVQETTGRVAKVVMAIGVTAVDTATLGVVGMADTAAVTADVGTVVMAAVMVCTAAGTGTETMVTAVDIMVADTEMDVGTVDTAAMVMFTRPITVVAFPWL